MAGFISKGTVLEQHKEPILSRPIRELLNPETAEMTFENPYENSDALFLDELIEIARKAQIIDEQDGISLADKLASAARRRKLYAVVADAVDDEPYVSSQLALIIHRREAVAEGLLLCAEALGVKRYCIAVYKNVIDLSVRIPHRIVISGRPGAVKIKRIRGTYPAENRTAGLYGRFRRKLVVGAGALLHLSRAVRQSRVQTTCFVTVAGNCIAGGANVEVSMGKTVEELLELCGLALDPTRIVVGGSMTGRSITDPAQERIMPTTRAVLALEDRKARRVFHCIGCGRCLQVCPQKLVPCIIYKHVRAERYDGMEIYDAARCEECGTCSYICPAELDVSAAVIRGKHHVLRLQAEQQLRWEERAEQRAEARRRNHLRRKRTGRFYFPSAAELTAFFASRRADPTEEAAQNEPPEKGNG